jgi:flagellar hook protein FlgE
MIRSMYAAISGLNAHQEMMDVVGDNIANVNTTGFKASTAVFEDILAQTQQGAGAATATTGSTNLTQIGLGTRIAGTETNFTEGSIESTGRATDVAISGDGFFSVSQGGSQLYTRNGSFGVDANGNLVTQEGGFVQGWEADPAGNIQTNGPVGKIQIPVGDVIAPVQTTNVTLGGNLPADAAIGTEVSDAVNVYDAQGNSTTVRLEFTKGAADSWSVAARYTDTAGNLQPPTTGAGQAVTGGPLTFDANGELTSSYALSVPSGFIPGFSSQAVAVNLGAAGGANRITQYGSLSSTAVLDQDGSAAGSLQSFSIGQDGVIEGSYSNGRNRDIAQLALATFANPEGLSRSGDSDYEATVSSGLAQVGVANSGGRGSLQSDSLEMSNVNLAQEFTNLIEAQRGFQANSRVITTSDSLLEDIVNLKQ